MWLAVLPPSVQTRFDSIAPVTHTLGVPCVIRSLQLLLWRPPLYWTARTTVSWTDCLAWMRKNQVIGCTPLLKGIGPPSGPRKSLQSDGIVLEGHRKCWPRSILCLASFYLVAIVCTVQESMKTLVLYALSTDNFSLCVCTTHFWNWSSKSHSSKWGRPHLLRIHSVKSRPPKTPAS